MFAVSSMLPVGLTFTLRQIVEPLRSLRLVALGLLANFVLVPAWAVLLTRLFALGEAYEIGLLLVSTAAGAPFLVKLVQLSDGDVSFATSLLVLFIPATIMYMPLVVSLVAPDADVDAVAVAAPLVLTNLLPLVVGVVILAAIPAAAERVRPVAAQLSTVALIALVVSMPAANAEELVDVFGERAIIAAFLLIAGAFLIGFVLGVPVHFRNETALATAQRNIAAATVVAIQAVGDPDTIVTVVVVSTVSIAVLFPLTTLLKKRAHRDRPA